MPPDHVIAGLAEEMFQEALIGYQMNVKASRNGNRQSSHTEPVGIRILPIKWGASAKDPATLKVGIMFHVL